MAEHTQHTPGPWYVDTGDEVHKDGRMICAWPKLSGRSVAQNRANMTLIAAAPEMLSLLHQLVELDWFEDSASMQDLVAEVIAKAEGKD